MSLQDQKGLWAMTNLPKLVKAEGATNYSSNGGPSWAIINDKDIDLTLDFMQMYRNVEFYNEILPATSAIATYTPAKEGSNYTAGSEFFNGEPIFAEIVEFGAQTPSNITGPYYYDAREATPEYVKTYLNQLEEIGCQSVVLAWDAMRMSDDVLSAIAAR